MRPLFPKKIKQGQEIRILTLSGSLRAVPPPIRRAAAERLIKLGYAVTFGKRAMKQDALGSSSVADRISDFNDAIRDENVAMILAADGGYNVNQLLPKLDYQLIRKNPKIICGYSDITALANAIYKKSGVVTYSGPVFQTFGMKKGFEYTEKFFQKIASKQATLLKLTPAKTWSDDLWKKNQNKRIFLKNKGYATLNPGTAQGTIIGGNLCTLNLLQGTGYLPKLKNAVLFIEDDDLVTINFAKEFERNLVSLLQQPSAIGIKALVVGRFQKKCRITIPLLKKIVLANPILNRIPIVANVDFGHTSPQITFPIGGTVKIIASNKNAQITLVRC